MTTKVTISGTNIQKVAKMLEEGNCFSVSYNNNSLTFKFDKKSAS